MPFNQLLSSWQGYSPLNRANWVRAPERRNESKVGQGRKKAYHLRQNVGLARMWVFDRVAGECSDLLALCRARRECGDPPAACFKQRDLIPNNDLHSRLKQRSVAL